MPWSSFQNRSPSTLPQIFRACFGASRHKTSMSSTPAAARRAPMPFEMPGKSRRSRCDRHPGRSSALIRANPSGLFISAPILASNSVGAMPMEHVSAGLNAPASAVLMRSASALPCAASLGVKWQTTSSMDRTRSTGKMVPMTARMRLCNRT